MDVSGLTRLATQMSAQRTNDAAGMAVFKKALDTQQSAAQQLISQITPASALPSHVGQNVNVVA
jgi:hypothetical protein